MEYALVRASFVPVQQCVSARLARGQWNVTLLSHPLTSVVVAKMLWQCVFKVRSDFLRNINKIVCIFGDLRVYYKYDYTAFLTTKCDFSYSLFPSQFMFAIYTLTLRLGWIWYLGCSMQAGRKLWTVQTAQLYNTYRTHNKWDLLFHSKSSFMSFISAILPI